MQTYKEYKDEIVSEQEGLTREQIHEQMKKQSDFMVELDNLPKQNHIFIDRGAKLTCENAGHPYHEVFKRIK